MRPVPWLEGLLAITVSLFVILYLAQACDKKAHADDTPPSTEWEPGQPLPPLPISTVATCGPNGLKLLCFDVAQARQLALYLKVVAPELDLKLQGEIAKAHEKDAQLAMREKQVDLLKKDLADYDLDLRSAADDLEACNVTVNEQAEIIEDEEAVDRRRKIAHFIVHAVAISAAAVFGVIAFR